MRKYNIGCLISIIVMIVLVIISIVLTKAIVNSDLPMWLKIFLL